MAEPLLTIEQLGKRFPGALAITALDDLTLTVAQGEVLGIVGESGSGKSTLARIIAGLESPSSGQVKYRGEPLPKRFRCKDFVRQAARVQMVFQDPSASLNPRMTVADIIAEPLRLQGRHVSAATVAHWLAKVNLPRDAGSRYPHEFSGGQRQRIGIARALVTEPELLICDEPISALDVSVQAQIVNLLLSLQRELGLTLLIIAHDLGMVRHICQRVAVMYRGQLMELTSAAQLFTQPRHPYSQFLLAANPEPVPGGVVATSDSGVNGLQPAAEAGGCRFRDRCGYADEQCANKKPLLQAVALGHQVACFKAKPEAALLAASQA
jgi:oligopeptide/dipeptide ABC transporter ATP-binding protein